MFLGKSKEILIAKQENRGDMLMRLANGGVGVFIFTNTIDFLQRD